MTFDFHFLMKKKNFLCLWMWFVTTAQSIAKLPYIHLIAKNLSCDACAFSNSSWLCLLDVMSLGCSCIVCLIAERDSGLGCSHMLLSVAGLCKCPEFHGWWVDNQSCLEVFAFMCRPTGTAWMGQPFFVRSALLFPFTISHTINFKNWKKLH